MSLLSWPWYHQWDRRASSHQHRSSWALARPCFLPFVHLSRINLCGPRLYPNMGLLTLSWIHHAPLSPHPEPRNPDERFSLPLPWFTPTPSSRVSAWVSPPRKLSFTLSVSSHCPPRFTPAWYLPHQTDTELPIHFPW